MEVSSSGWRRRHLCRVDGDYPRAGHQHDQAHGELRLHALRVFASMFRRDAFLPSVTDPRTFHFRALEEGKFYEVRVAADLSNLVVDHVHLCWRVRQPTAQRMPRWRIYEKCIVTFSVLAFEFSMFKLHGTIALE